MKKIILMVVLMAGVGLGWGESSTETVKGEVKKIKLEKIWEKEFKDNIDEISLSSDENRIIVKTQKKKDKYTFDTKGKELDKRENYVGKILKKGGTLKSTGEILDDTGKYVSKIKLGNFDIELPIFSPTEKYVAVIPGYDADYVFLRVYEVDTGNLLWEYKGEQGVLTISFINDEKFAAYIEQGKKGIIILYDTKTGNKVKEKQVIDKTNDKYLNTLMNTSVNGDIILFHSLNKTIYSLDNNLNIRWIKENIGNCRKMEFSDTGDFIAIVYSEIDTAGEKLAFIDNKTGKVLWQKKVNFGNVLCFLELEGEKYILLHGFIPNEDKEVRETRIDKKGRTYNLSPQSLVYLFNTDGKLLWKNRLLSSTGENIGLKKSEYNNKTFISDRNILLYFNLK